VTRIVAGLAGGRRLSVPPGRRVRPTPDRVREALFSTLQSICGELAGRTLLDLYAGTGAVGLEALSRGAGAVTLVESDPRTARVLRTNLAAVGLAGGSVREEPVERLVATSAPAGFDVVFADPPYAMTAAALDRLLLDLAGNGWLAAGSVLVVERPVAAPEPGWPPGVQPDRSRRYGDTVLWYGRAARGAEVS
jgi:16S rRNA (guanine966-N2)-methyltransferase